VLTNIPANLVRPDAAKITAIDGVPTGPPATKLCTMWPNRVWVVEPYQGILAMALSVVEGIEVRNSVRLSNEHLRLLWNDWSRLATVAPDLAEPALHFIVDGDRPEILQKLAANAGCGRALGLHGTVDWQTKGGDRKARLAFFQKPPQTDGSFYLRLAQAYDAAATTDRKPNRHRSANLPAWIDLMLAETTANSDHTLGGISYRPKGPKVGFSAEVFEQMLIAGGGALHLPGGGQVPACAGGCASPERKAGIDSGSFGNRGKCPTGHLRKRRIAGTDRRRTREVGGPKNTPRCGSADRERKRYRDHRRHRRHCPLPVILH
jgi:hypothetical protein